MTKRTKVLAVDTLTASSSVRGWPVVGVVAFTDGKTYHFYFSSVSQTFRFTQVRWWNRGTDRVRCEPVTFDSTPRNEAIRAYLAGLAALGAAA